MTMPRVTVLLPIKFPAPWLCVTLEALNLQSYRNFILFLLIHGSDEIPTEYLENLNFEAKIFQVPETKSLSDVLNTGLFVTDSEFIARIDSDDVPDISRFEKQVRYLDDHPDSAGVGSYVYLIDEDGLVVGKRNVPTKGSAVLKRALWRNPLIHPSMMLRREKVIEVGGYSSIAHYVEDYELWLRLLAQNELNSIPECLTSYRLHSKQVTRVSKLTVSSADQILRSRLALATARNKSIFFTKIKHRLWVFRQ